MILLRAALYISAIYLAGVNGDTWNNLYVTYGQYNSVPLSQAALEESNYTLVTVDEELGLNFYVYLDDPRVSIGVDSHGNIAGVRVNLIKADIEKKAEENNLTFPFDFSDRKACTSGTVLDTEVYYNTVLFRNPETLKPRGRINVRERWSRRHMVTAASSWSGQQPNSGVLEVENVYVMLDDGWTVVPKNECDAPAGGFVKEGCIPGMGMHYFYGMTSTLDCKYWQGVFGLYNNGSLIGLGLPTHGYQSTGADRTWFEEPTSMALQYIIPNERADCITDWTVKYGMTAVHIYFNEDPASLTCSSEETTC